MLNPSLPVPVPCVSIDNYSLGLLLFSRSTAQQRYNLLSVKVGIIENTCRLDWTP